jgi:thiamine-monophosphate kinase
LSLTALGEVAAGAEIRRSSARVGDRIWVSGTIGDAYLGLRALRGEFPELDPALREALIARYRLPEPRTALGPRLAAIAHAMCDVSDGLLADLGHICDASRMAATVTLPALPFSAAAKAILAGGRLPPAALAGGGDDYELLFTAPPEAEPAIAALSAALRLRVTAIGVIEEGGGVRLVDARGDAVPVAAAGYRHF